MGGDELLHHAEESLGVKAGATTADGLFTLEGYECQAACTEAPCLQVNYRYFHQVTPADFDSLVDDLRAGRLADDVPPHGTLARTRQQIPADRAAGPAAPGGRRAAGVARATRAALQDRASSLMSWRTVTVTDAQPIVSTRFGLDDGHTLERYLATGGYEGLRAALRRPPAQVVEEVKTASLLGRGGAGFPAGVKWGFCPPGVFPRYLVVNGDESEPGTYKDRILMERDPHQLIEGVLIACYAVGLSQAFLYVRGEMALAQERIAEALNEAYAAGYVGKNILGTDFSVDVVLHWGAGAYIVGEETALIESLEGNRGMPRLKPPYFPAAIGLYGQPTIVNNVETLSNLPWIMHQRRRRVRRPGRRDRAGHAPVRRVRSREEAGRVRGRVRRDDLPRPHRVAALRRRRARRQGPQGVHPRRSVGAVVLRGAPRPPLEPGAVGKAGSMLGSGAIVVMDEDTDAVRACHRVVRFFARESCGKCTPCREGTSWLEKILQRIIDGHGRPSDVGMLLDVCDNISPRITWPPRQTTICPLGPSAVSPIASAVDAVPRRVRGVRRGARSSCAPRSRARPTDGWR